jgi:MATE family multidrug resistance protein
MFGVPPFLVFVALRQSLQAMHRLSALLWAIVATNALNALLDWVLIFGKLGVPAMGVAGSAWATAVSRWGLVAALVLFARKDLRALLLARAGRVLAWRPLGRMVAIGIPVGLQFLVEYATFAGVAVLVGTLGADQLAGHQVALTLSSMSFMVPLGISMAGSVLVGNAIGRGDPAGVAAASKLTLAAGAGVMVLFAILFLGAPGPLASIFTDLESVHTLAVLLIPIAGIFQVFDGTQVSAMGVLRGMADTRVPMLIHLGGFWGIGIPLACYLGFERGLGARGFWWGLVAGLAAVAVVQVLRVFVKLSHGVERLDLGEPPHPPLPPESERPV